MEDSFSTDGGRSGVGMIQAHHGYCALYFFFFFFCTLFLFILYFYVFFIHPLHLGPSGIRSQMLETPALASPGSPRSRKPKVEGISAWDWVRRFLGAQPPTQRCWLQHPSSSSPTWEESADSSASLPKPVSCFSACILGKADIHSRMSPKSTHTSTVPPSRQR